jgi:hypothetical protein
MTSVARRPTPQTVPPRLQQALVLDLEEEFALASRIAVLRAAGHPLHEVRRMSMFLHDDAKKWL